MSLKLTGTTNQGIVDIETKIKDIIWLPGVYRSYNLDDAEPMQAEFSLQCSGGLEIVGNDLAAVLHQWREYCAEVEVVDVIRLNRVG